MHYTGARESRAFICGALHEQTHPLAIMIPNIPIPMIKIHPIQISRQASRKFHQIRVKQPFLDMQGLYVKAVAFFQRIIIKEHAPHLKD